MKTLVKRMLAGLTLAGLISLLSGCYVAPGYSYVRGGGYAGDAYYGSGPAVVYNGYYDPYSYPYGYGYYGGYWGGYAGCCYGGWYGRGHYWHGDHGNWHGGGHGWHGGGHGGHGSWHGGHGGGGHFGRH